MNRKVVSAKLELPGDVRLWRVALSCGHKSTIVAKGRLKHTAPKNAYCCACEQQNDDRMVMMAIGKTMFSKMFPSKQEPPHADG